MAPTVTIIIPCYNAEPFLRETLDSTLRQTVAPHEVILVDDGSTDKSAAIARSYGPPVKVIAQPNQGESVAMNAALAAATGEHVIFLGADDVLHPELIEHQLRALDGRPNAVACTGFAFFMGDISAAFHPTMPRASAFFPEIIASNLCPPSCWMYPKERIIQAGCFHAPQRYFEDWDLNFRVALTGAQLIPVEVVGFYYRQHEKSQLASLAPAERAYGHAWVMERMCRAFLDRPDLLEAHGDRLFWSALAAVRACRSHDVPWERLSLLTHVLREVVERRPACLEASRLAVLVRKVGVRRAELLGRFKNGDTEAPNYRAPWLARPAVREQ